MWYNPKEMPARFGIWTVMNGALPIPMLLIYYGLGHVTSTAIKPWQYIFLLLGLLSTLTGGLLVSRRQRKVEGRPPSDSA